MLINKEAVRVLVVDDSQLIRDLLPRFLTKIGYKQIEKAEDGIQALDLAKDYLPHLVIMDTNMPGPYGYEVCRQMRQEDYGRSVAIIGMSADYNPQLRDEWLQVGADDFFSKLIASSEKGMVDLDARILSALEKYHQ